MQLGRINGGLYVIKNVDLNVPLKVSTAAASDIETRNYLNTINTNFPNIINNSRI